LSRKFRPELIRKIDSILSFNKKGAEEKAPARRSPPRNDKPPEEPPSVFRKSSTLERRAKASSPNASRFQPLPIRVPSTVPDPPAAGPGPGFDSLPNSLEVQKPFRLTSVLKKPGSGKSDRKSLKKVAFLESGY
jgi:hypothetical protein